MTDTPPPEEPSKPVEPAEAELPTTEVVAAPVEPGDPWTETGANPETAADPAATQPNPDLKNIDIPIVMAIVALFLSLLVRPLTPYKFLGLPSHAIIVHAAVVFIPLLAIAALVALWVEKWRNKFSGWLAGASIAVFAITTAAVQSGHELRNHLFGANLKDFAIQPRGGITKGGFPPPGNFLRATSGNGENALVQRHALWASRLHWIVLALAIVLVGHFIIRRVKATNTAPVTLVFKLVGTVVAAATLACVVYVGHLGAQATWQDRLGSKNSVQTIPYLGNGRAGGRFFGGGSAGAGGIPGGPATPGNNLQNRLRQYRSQTGTSGQTSPQNSGPLSQTNGSV